MKRPPAAVLLFAAAATSLLDCTLGGFCSEGTPGCADPGCHDAVKDLGEADVDCGGPCAPCADGRTCAAASDCASGLCLEGQCCGLPCGSWAKTYGSVLDDLATGVAVAPDGTVYVVGSFSGIVELGGGPLVSAGGADVFVVALDAAGNHRWSVCFGGPLDDGPARVVAGADGLPVVAIESKNQSLDLGGGPLVSYGVENTYLVSLDAQGNHGWSRAYPTHSNLWPGGLAVAPNGDLLLIGTFQDVDLGSAGTFVSAGGYDVLLARLDATGQPVWGQRFGGTADDLGQCVAVDAAGDILVAVAYEDSWSFGGPTLPLAHYSTAVAKLDGQGGHLWSHGYVSSPPVNDPVPPTQYQMPAGLAVDAQGNVWVAGAFSVPVDFLGTKLTPGVSSSAFVLKLDANGETTWARGFGEDSAGAHAIVPDGQGGVVLSGRYRGNVDFGGGVTLEVGLDQLFVARLDAGGNGIWARGDTAFVGSPSTGTGLSTVLATGATGAPILLAGGFRGTFGLGPVPLTSLGGADAFVAALLP